MATGVGCTTGAGGWSVKPSGVGVGDANCVEPDVPRYPNRFDPLEWELLLDSQAAMTKTANAEPRTITEDFFISELTF